MHYRQLVRAERAAGKSYEQAIKIVAKREKLGVSGLKRRVPARE
jgi:hypothetical protein